ncbi:ABC transporter permease [Phosphitispora sp. TUW77]|uniref:ABC transporter permease n=1 Tax=Phosphitispora sp. TUW77 TaxID=3152361 RepID=UPI003AB28EBB
MEKYSWSLRNLQQKCAAFLSIRLKSLGGVPEVLILIILCLSPLLALAGLSITEAFRGNTEVLSLITPEGRRISLLVGTVVLGSGVAAAGILIGTLAASAFMSINSPWKGSLVSLVFLFAVIPPYIHALSWQALLETVNNVLNWFSLPEIVLAGWFGSWWIQLMAFTPLAVGLGILGFEAVSPILIEAGRIMRGDLTVFTRIVLPLAMPMVAAGGAFLFLLSVTDYSVPVLFQKSVYTLEIFAEYSSNGYPWNAFWLSIPLLLIIFVVLFFSQYPLKKAAMSRFKTNKAWSNPPKWPSYFSFLQAAACVIVGLVIFVPVLTLILQTGSVGQMLNSILAAKEEILFSLGISAVSAAISLIPAVFIAGKITGSKAVSWLGWVALLLPVSVPPPLVGIGLIAIWNRTLPVDVYGSSLMPVLASLARFLPLAVLIMASQMRRIDPLLMEAAKVMPVSGLSKWTQIKIPLITPGLIASFCTVFALTMGELGAAIIVVPPGNSTLAIRIFNLLHYGAGDSVSGLCLFQVIIILFAVLIGALSMRFGQYCSQERGCS